MLSPEGLRYADAEWNANNLAASFGPAVLEVLLHKGPLTISVIGEKVLLASASMTSAIDRLEIRELVRRS